MIYSGKRCLSLWAGIFLVHSKIREMAAISDFESESSLFLIFYVILAQVDGTALNIPQNSSAELFVKIGCLLLVEKMNEFCCFFV